jgi:hypothetical protein
MHDLSAFIIVKQSKNAESEQSAVEVSKVKDESNITVSGCFIITYSGRCEPLLLYPKKIAFHYITSVQLDLRKQITSSAVVLQVVNIVLRVLSVAPSIVQLRMNELTQKSCMCAQRSIDSDVSIHAIYCAHRPKYKEQEQIAQGNY